MPTINRLAMPLLALVCLAGMCGCAAAPADVAPTPQQLEMDANDAPSQTTDLTQAATPAFPLTDPDSVASPYDLQTVLSLEAAQIPAVMERLGFQYQSGAPTGAWENVSADTPLSPEDASTSMHFSVGGGETSPDLMSEGRQPQAVGMTILLHRVAEDETENMCESLLQAAGLGSEYSRTTSEYPAFDRKTVTRIGTCDDGGAEVAWMLSVFANAPSESYASTQCSLTVYTREGVMASENRDLQAAIGEYPDGRS